jgi:Ca2+-transporting ATPase
VFEAEPEEPDVMCRPPRAIAARLFGKRLVVVSLSLGLSVTAILLGAFAIAYHGGSEAEARAITFSILILANLALIFTGRSWKASAAHNGTRNPALWWITAGTLVFLAATLYLPPLPALFRFDLLHATDLAICVGAAIVGTAWFELLKASRARRAPTPARAPKRDLAAIKG